MSHLATLKTKMIHPKCIEQAALALGVELQEGMTPVYEGNKPAVFQSRFVIDQYGVTGATGAEDLILCTEKWPYGCSTLVHGEYYGKQIPRRLGFAKQADGSYAAVGDLAGMADVPMRKLDPNWVHGAFTPQCRFNPTKLQQEYCLQVGQAAAQVYGMDFARIDQPNGAIHLRMTGGAIPPGGSIILEALPDGNCKVGAYNIMGPSCQAATKWLEDFLGQVTDDTLTGEFFHQTTSSNTIRHRS